MAIAHSPSLDWLAETHRNRAVVMGRQGYVMGCAYYTAAARNARTENAAGFTLPIMVTGPTLPALWLIIMSDCRNWYAAEVSAFRLRWQRKGRKAYGSLFETSLVGYGHPRRVRDPVWDPGLCLAGHDFVRVGLALRRIRHAVVIGVLLLAFSFRMRTWQRGMEQRTRSISTEPCADCV